MRLVVLGDIHFFRLWAHPRHYFSRRFVGQANVWFSRRFRFDPTLLPRVLERVTEVKPDMLLLSGDVSSTALMGEFGDVAEVLAPLRALVPSVIVPGNHDRYTFASARTRLFERLMAPAPERYPHFQSLTPGTPASTSGSGNPRWHLLALDSAVPRLISSRGRVGRRQLEQAREMVSVLPPGDGIIVLCHYPLGTPPGMPEIDWHHDLEDRNAVQEFIACLRGPVIYLHGHIHWPWRWNRDGEGLEHVIDLNAGAPCLREPAHPAGQGFWEIHLPQESQGPPASGLKLIHHRPSTAPGDTSEVLTWTVHEPTGEP